MPVVAIVNGIRIEFYFDEHPPPHLHARYAEFVAQIDLETLEVKKGSKAADAGDPGMGIAKTHGIAGGLEYLQRRRKPWENRMTEIPRIVATEPVIHGVLKIQWDDGYVGIVDLRPVIARGKIFTYLQKPENFEKLRIGEHGHGIVWINENGEEIDFGSDSLRQRAEKQAELHRVAG